MDRINVKLKIESGLENEQSAQIIADALEELAMMIRETQGQVSEGKLLADDVELHYVHLKEIKGGKK